VIVRGATVFPGDAPPLETDVVVEGGRIAAVGGGLGGEDAIDGRGLWLCPGFVDLHAHTALRPWVDPALPEVVSQGVTTQVINPDGLAPAPVAPGRRRDRQAYLAALEGPGPD
jgi:N-acyl-D-amino-acid deacylase